MSAEYDDIDDLPEYDLTENEALSNELDEALQIQADWERRGRPAAIDAEALRDRIAFLRAELGRDE